MKQIKIRSLKYPDPAINWDFQAESEEPKLSEMLASGICGLPERWVLHKDEPMAEAYDEADVLEEELREASPAVDAVLDEQGVEVSPAVPAVMQKWVKLKAEYTIEIEDITAQVAQDAINAEALAYLASTDWLIIREVDAGVACPADIKTLRAEARAKVVR
jgi:phage gp36-like protein